jgi:hypothetical protein
MLKKEKILLTGNDLNIQLPIQQSNDFLGYQQEIDGYVDEQVRLAVNPPTDKEVSKYKYIKLTQPILSFIFSHGQRTSTGFINLKDDAYNNSFFILDVYDSPKIGEQVKIFTTYLTKLNGVGVDDDNRAEYNLISGNEFYSLNVPIYYTSNNDITYAYGKFSFYNARTGKLNIFYDSNKEDQLINSSDGMFFEMIFANSNNSKVWAFTTPYSPNITAKELINNDAYIERMDNTFDNFDNLEENYPEGNTITGNTYSTT